MSETLEYSGTLTVVKCWCGMRHAYPTELREFQLRERDEGRYHSVYCPLGHTHSPRGKGRAAELEEELQRERQKLDQTRAALRDKENQLNAEKAAKSRMRNRVQAGVCPCCNRTFANLARHMKTKHPQKKESP